MELESYFDFLPDGDIRIKGTRVYLEDIIGRYFEGDSPEEINSHFPTTKGHLRACLKIELGS